MRDIKFRAWIHGAMAEHGILDYNIILKNVQNDKCILMQYTGIKDKNGKEIYEGDIVSKGNGEIYWNNKRHAFYVKWHHPTWIKVRSVSQNYRLNNGEELFNNSDIAWEIIGNIYQNPKLLGDKN